MSQVAYRVDLVRPGEQVRNTSDSGCKLSRNEPRLNTASYAGTAREATKNGFW